MRLLDRYLLYQLLIPLVFCLCGFLIFWIAFSLMTDLGELQEHKLLFRDVVEYYLVSLPAFLVQVLPIVLLLALLYTLTNHARHHELTAMRAAGISLWRIGAPYLAVGFLLTVALFALNEECVPNALDHADAIKNRYSAKRAESDPDIRRNVSIRNGRDDRFWIIHSYNLKTRVMIQPEVDWTSNGEPRRLIAGRAEWTGESWKFFNAQIYGTNSLPEVRSNELVMAELTETPDQIRREISFNNRFVLHTARSPEVPVLEIIDYLRLHPRDLPARNEWWLKTQLHGRLAAPWTCLVVVLIAIPFGGASGRRNLFMGVAGSIFICFTYFVLLRVGMALGTGGYLPAWLAAWLPNLCFASAGIWMILRVR
jgi:lipopolysaccharide export system permease protein